MPKHAKPFCKEQVPKKMMTMCSLCPSTVSAADPRGLETAMRLHYKLKHKSTKPESTKDSDHIDAAVGRRKRGQWQDYNAPKVDN